MENRIVPQRNWGGEKRILDYRERGKTVIRVIERFQKPTVGKIEIPLYININPFCDFSHAVLNGISWVAHKNNTLKRCCNRLYLHEEHKHNASFRLSLDLASIPRFRKLTQHVPVSRSLVVAVLQALLFHSVNRHCLRATREGKLVSWLF